MKVFMSLLKKWVGRPLNATAEFHYFSSDNIPVAAYNSSPFRVMQILHYYLVPYWHIGMLVWCSGIEWLRYTSMYVRLWWTDKMDVHTCKKHTHTLAFKLKKPSIVPEICHHTYLLLIIIQLNGNTEIVCTETHQDSQLMRAIQNHNFEVFQVCGDLQPSEGSAVDSYISTLRQQ